MTGLKTPQTARKRTLANLYPRERWTPAEWAEHCRELSAEESSEPGPYNFDRTPYWRDVLDWVGQPGIEEVVCLKGAQIGWSEACRNVMGYWVDLDPGPILVLMPDQKAAEDFRSERIDPLIKHTEAVRRHVSARAWDTTRHRIRFDTCSMFFVWAGSKAGTKSRPIRYLVCEEPDEYPAFSSTGGDPLSKAEKRLTTYRDKGRAKILIGGTPTTRLGNMWKRWESCEIKYHMWLPCPHCNGYQRLLWKQVKWPDLKAEMPDRAKRAGRIYRERLAYYECEHCKQPIRDHHKPRMLMRRVWATEDQVVTVDGRVVGPAPAARRIGVFVPGQYSPWVPFSELAKEQIEADGDVQKTADFVNQRLAEPFEEQRTKTEPDFIAEKAKGAPPPLVVPKWARLLIATADTQGNNEQDGHFWYVVRAWGYDYRSQLVDFGVCHSFGELKQRCLDRPLAIEGGGQATPMILLIDSGGPRWNEVYQFSRTDPRIHPAKGDGFARDFMCSQRPQKAHGVVLWKIDTEQSKDLLHRLIHDPDRTKWMPHAGVNDDYCRQMCAEQKIYDPKENRERWAEIVKNNNHLWDCEHMQTAAAWQLGASLPEPPAESVRPDPQNNISASQWMSGGRKW